MRILNIIQCANLGGMEHSALLLLVELKKMGHHVELLSLNKLGGLETKLNEHGIPSAGLEYKGIGGWRSFLPLRRWLAKSNADALIMTGHNLMATVAIGDFCRRRRILTWHYHHQDVKSIWTWRLIYWLSIQRFSAIVYPSQFIASEACSIMPALEHVSWVISYPFQSPPSLTETEQADLKKAARAQLGISQDAKVLGNAGWLIPRKRWDVFLQVAAQVMKDVPDLQLAIAGDGPEKDSLQKMATELGIAKQIHWLGWREDLEPFYRAIDVLLFNSDWDAMGRTPLESMAHGVPTVASLTHGGLGEVIGDSECAYFLKTHDIGALSAKAASLFLDPDSARRMGQLGRKRIIEVGSPRMHAEQILALLEAPDIPSVAV
jgi:glycosyltransferase involved in cell wall biosynthesis